MQPLSFSRFVGLGHQKKVPLIQLAGLSQAASFRSLPPRSNGAHPEAARTGTRGFAAGDATGGRGTATTDVVQDPGKVPTKNAVSAKVMRMKTNSWNLKIVFLSHHS